MLPNTPVPAKTRTTRPVSSASSASSASSVSAPATTTEVIGGVDTHADTHTVVAITGTGVRLGHAQFPATRPGYTQLANWLTGHGTVTAVGIEGTSSYGAGLTRHLTAAGLTVHEVNRPDRAGRRAHGKTDPIDAEAAARTVLTGHTSTPKTQTGPVESLRLLRIARTSAITDRAKTLTRIRSIIITAPAELRTTLEALPTARLIATCARYRPDPTRIHHPDQAAKLTLRSLARRYHHLTEEIDTLDPLLHHLVTTINAGLLTARGVGVDTAGQLLVTAGDNPHRLHSDAAFAALCGASPIPASSGKTTRHRLNRGGDRQANAALYRVVLSRLRWDPDTQAYKARRTAQGRTTKDIIRCLKRHIARELYYLLTHPQPTT